MSFNTDIHHRRSIRLKNYDYSRQGGYFVTIRTHGGISRFGEIKESTMRLNQVGQMIEEIWKKLPERFPHIVLDFHIVMPNHFHGVLLLGAKESVNLNNLNVGAPLVGAHYEPNHQQQPEWASTRDAPTLEKISVKMNTLDVEAQLVGARYDTDVTQQTDDQEPLMKTSGIEARFGLGDIIGAFKSLTTLAYGYGVKRSGWPTYSTALWQRNYYEHIIHNEDNLHEIQTYILNNPRRWSHGENDFQR